MDPQKSQHIPKVRTFAADVRRAKGEAGEPDLAPASKTPAEPLTHPSAPPKPPEPQAPVPPKAAGTSDLETKKEAVSPKQESQSAAPYRPPQRVTTPLPKSPLKSIPMAHTPRKVTPPSAKPTEEKRPAGVREMRGSHLTDKDDVFDIQGAATGSEEGTIVKDMKRNRWSLSRELAKSVKQWAEDTKETLTDREKETSGIAPASQRTSVIKEAGEDGRLAPADDHGTVVKKLRTFQQDAERATGKPFAFKTDIPEEKETPQWKQINESPGASPARTITEGAAHALHALKRARKTRAAPLENREDVIAKRHDTAVAPRATQSLPDTVFEDSFSERSSPEKETAERKPAKATREHLIAPLPPEPEKEPPKETAPDKAEPEAAEQIQPQPEMVEAKTPSRDIGFTLPTFATKETENIRTLRHDAVADVTRRKLSVPRIAGAEARKRSLRKGDIDLRPRRTFLPILGPIMGIVLLIGGITGAYFLFQSDEAETPTVVRIPSFVQTIEQRSIPLPETREALLSAFRQAIQDASGPAGSLVQIYPVTDSVPGTPATTDEIFAVLDIRAPGSFIRALTDRAMFGAYIDLSRQPFIILEVEQFDTAFAGMLAWEENMSADLAPLFGEPVRRTLDPTARTNDQTRAARFVDTTLRNHDVRILFNELGEERIIYSFIDSDTILITTTPEAFITVVESR